METISDPSDIQEWVVQNRLQSKSIGFVPTMGALHVGHLSLIERARKECDLVIVSIFVNPKQFGPNEDLEKYPRTIEEDLQLCSKAGVDLVFHPQSSDMYPQDGDTLLVTYPELSKKLCGKFRPGHFDGVTTVMCKLLTLISPDKCYMGKKDAQQLIIVQKMARDIFSQSEIIGCPTVREESGLAMSSRNRYLTDQDREQASLIFSTLSSFAEELKNLNVSQSLDFLLEKSIKILPENGFEVQYFDFVDRDSLESAKVLLPGKFLVCVAAILGETRLIDNLFVDVDQNGKANINE